jgi:hypothetical protein
MIYSILFSIQFYDGSIEIWKALKEDWIYFIVAFCIPE